MAHLVEHRGPGHILDPSDDDPARFAGGVGVDGDDLVVRL